MVEPGQKALVLLWAQHDKGLGLWGRSNLSGDRDLSLFACSYFADNWFIEKTVSSGILGTCSCRRETGFTGILSVIKVAEVHCVIGGMGVILGYSSPFLKCFHHLRGLGQTSSSFSSFNSGEVREYFFS